MGDLAMGLDLGPPDAAMAQTDAILAQGFGDDDVIDTVGAEIAALCQIGDPAKAARFLIRRAADFNRPGIVGAGGDEGLRRDNARRQPALHVAGPAPVYTAVAQLAAKGLHGPAMAHLDHVNMAVEMHASTGARALAPRDDIPARMPVAVAGCAMRADHLRREPRLGQPPVQIVAELAIVHARRVQRRDTDQVLRERNQIRLARRDLVAQPLLEGHRLTSAGQIAPVPEMTMTACFFMA